MDLIFDGARGDKMIFRNVVCENGKIMQHQLGPQDIDSAQYLVACKFLESFNRELNSVFQSIKDAKIHDMYRLLLDLEEKEQQIEISESPFKLVFHSTMDYQGDYRAIPCNVFDTYLRGCLISKSIIILEESDLATKQYAFNLITQSIMKLEDLHATPEPLLQSVIFSNVPVVVSIVYRIITEDAKEDLISLCIHIGRLLINNRLTLSINKV